MSGDFRKYPEIEAVYSELASPQPGQFARADLRDDNAVREYLARWSHQWTPCWKPNHDGQEI